MYILFLHVYTSTTFLIKLFLIARYVIILIGIPTMLNNNQCEHWCARIMLTPRTIYSQGLPEHKANPPRILEYSMRLDACDLSPMLEKRINNREWNVNDRHVSTSAVSTTADLGLGSTGDFDAGIPRELFIHQALVRLTGETGIS